MDAYEEMQASLRGDEPDELAACPFCGGYAAHNTMRTSDKETIKLNGQDTFYGVNCVLCGANNRGLLGYSTPEEAAAHWNKRVMA